MRRAHRTLQLLSAVVAAVVPLAGAGPAAAEGDPDGRAVPDDGLVTGDDMPDDWQSGPPEDDTEDEEFDRLAAEIDECDSIRKLTRKVRRAPQLDGPTLTLDGQEITSTVAVLDDKTTAKRAIAVYRSGAAACFEELFDAAVQGAAQGVDATVETQTSRGPDAGDASVLLAAEVTAAAQGGEESLFFQLVLVRARRSLAAYEFQSEDVPGDEDAFADAIDAAAGRFEDAA